MPEMIDQARAAIANMAALEEPATLGPWREGVPGNLQIYGADGAGAESGAILTAVGGTSDPRRRANLRYVVSIRNSAPARDALLLALLNLASEMSEREKRELDITWPEAQAALSAFVEACG